MGKEPQSLPTPQGQTKYCKNYSYSLLPSHLWQHPALDWTQTEVKGKARLQWFIAASLWIVRCGRRQSWFRVAICSHLASRRSLQDMLFFSFFFFPFGKDSFWDILLPHSAQSVSLSLWTVTFSMEQKKIIYSLNSHELVESGILLKSFSFLPSNGIAFFPTNLLYKKSCILIC